MEKIIDKIKKLLALSQDNCNINEAMAAASQAQRLITKHNITECMLQSENENEIYNFTTMGYPLDVFLGAKQNIDIPLWKMELATTVTKHNMCATYISNLIIDGNPIKALGLIGTLKNGAFSRFLYSYLKIELDKLCGKYDKGAKWQQSFRLGAIKTIDKRLREVKEEVKNNIEKEYSHSSKDIKTFSTGIALYESQENEAERYMLNELKVEDKETIQTEVNIQAEALGKSDAKKIDLCFDKKLKKSNIDLLGE